MTDPRQVIDRPRLPFKLLGGGLLIGLGALPVVIMADHSLMRLVQTWRWPGLLEAMQLFTRLGYGAIDIGGLLAIALIGWCEGKASIRARGLWGAGTVAAAGILDQIVKNIACRARPSAPGGGLFFATFPCFPASYAYASFPSGHATTAFAAAVILAAWHPRRAGTFLGVAALVGLSRIVLGAHFPSDVLAGALLGSGTALAACRSVLALRGAGTSARGTTG